MRDDDMFMNFYNTSNNSLFHASIASLIYTHRDQFYEALYQAIHKNTSYVVLSELEQDKKINIINGIIEYYEAKEAYEKCAELIDVKNKIKEYVKD